MSEPQPRWQGWARLPGKPWQKIDGALCETRAKCYEQLMLLVALAGEQDLHHEFEILPEGEYPPVQTTYRDRMLRPRLL